MLNKFSPPLTCTIAVELAKARWLIGILPPQSGKVTIQTIKGGDAKRLMTIIEQTAERLARENDRPVQIKVCYEIGFDGFWLARYLQDRDVDVYVLDPSSFLVSRRGRRSKTDRIDAQAMTFTLRAYISGDKSVCRVVTVPTPEEEDAKRLSRERTRLASERTRHVNRIRGLLSLNGVCKVEGLFGGSWRSQLDTLQTADGRPLGQYLKKEIAREFERLHLVLEQKKAVEMERHDMLSDPDSPFPAREKAVTLCKLAGIGELSATLLVSEVFHRSFANRRHLASYLGLSPTPYASGESTRDQGISKAGNKPARTLLVEIAWVWLRHQPKSALTSWYRNKFAGTGSRGRKVGIVALARKLAIALWRFVEEGVVPDGATVKA